MIRRTRALLTLAGALVVAACAVTTDDEPRIIAAENVPGSLLENTTTSTPTTQPADTTTVERVFYLIRSSEESGTELVPVVREVDVNRDIDEIISLLFELQPDETDPNEATLTNATRGLEVIDAEISSGSTVLVLELAPTIQELQGTEARNAFAQIVYTATERNDITAVRFEVRSADGSLQPILPFVDEGSVSDDPRVDRLDYRGLRPE